MCLFKYGLLYDLAEWPLEKLLFRRARPTIFARAKGSRLLEVGIGTGKNIPFYPVGAEAVGIDISPGMLKRAARRARWLGKEVELRLMDVQELHFDDAFFDLVISSLVFCSVAEPLRGLAEIKRVLRPDGQLIMMEHVRPNGRLLGPLFDAMSRLTIPLFGEHLNRPTVSTVERAGFVIDQEANIYGDVIKLLVARPISKFTPGKGLERAF